MSPDDLEAWKAQEPPPGFAARVVAEARLERGRGPARGRPARVAAGVLLVASLAAAASYAAHVRGRGSAGEITADARREVRVGPRAVAVLEPGTHLSWKGDAVEQSSGESFWRVEPGARFVVRTPAGEVTVMGTCFRVKVLGGAALAAAVVVVVYEGKVALAHRGTSITLGAGETGRSDERGVSRGDEGASGQARAQSDHAVATLDRARADRMRSELRALFAEAGVARPSSPAPPEPPPGASAAPAFPTMPVVPDDAGDGTPKVDPSYIQRRVREDLFPLAKQCYEDALRRDPRMGGTVEVHFTIMGDPRVGGVVGEASLGDRTTLADPEMQTCVRESMMSVTFDAPPEGGEITVVYPIVFSPDEDDGGR